MSYALDQQYNRGILSKNDDDEKNDKKLKYQFRIMKKLMDKKSLNFTNSPHVSQVQSSKFLKIDDDFLIHSNRVKKEMRDGNWNASEREDMLFGALSEMHMKYL